jgi:tetratricopeptide (TPR) repeat protein
LLRAQDELQNSSGASNALETKKIQALVANSINGAETAVTLNPQNVNNWLIRGYIYQSLFNATGDLSYESRAVASYDGALKLNPNDPYSLAQKGNVFLVAALKSTQDQAQQRSQYFSQAREQLEKAVSIKPDYSNALYSLGSVYDFLNQKDKAIEVFTKIQQLNPQNTDIKKILDSLNAGLPAPKITTPTVENPPSVGTVSNPATSSKTK